MLHLKEVSESYELTEAKVSASWDKIVKLWDVESGKCIKTYEGHTDYVNSVSISTDGQYIVSGSDDGIVRLWRFDSLQDLIDGVYEQFKDNPLTDEERREYYLE